MRLKDVTKLNPTHDVLRIDDEVSFVPMECLRYDNVTSRTIRYSEASGSYTEFEEGDLLIAKVTPCFENGNIAIAKNLIRGVGFGSSEIFVLRPTKKINNRYLFYSTFDNKFISFACASMCGVGGLKRISPKVMRTYEIILPPLSEQKAIANYLDDKCGKIDEQVKLLEKKVDAYKKLKRSVINETVTRGLDKNVKLKDSGVDWLGMVPEAWEVTRFKTVCEELSAGKRPSDDPEEVFSIGGEHIQNGKFSLDVPRYVSRKTYNSSRGKIKIGDILVVKDGATIGKAMYVDVMPEDEMLLNEHVYRVVANKFYFYWIISSKGEKWFRVMNTSTAQESIPQDVMYSLPILCPPISEQQAIVNYLDDKCTKIDKAIELVEKQIAAYKRLKRSLINEVVTGKRRVA